MHFGEHTVICTYRVRADARERFLPLLEQHWPTLNALGLASDAKPLIFESTPNRKPGHDDLGPTFVEIFSWAGPDAPRVAHETPAVMAVWEPMGALVESRDGKPPMEFLHYRPINGGA